MIKYCLAEDNLSEDEVVKKFRKNASFDTVQELKEFINKDMPYPEIFTRGMDLVEIYDSPERTEVLNHWDAESDTLPRVGSLIEHSPRYMSDECLVDAYESMDKHDIDKGDQSVELELIRRAGLMDKFEASAGESSPGRPGFEDVIQEAVKENHYWYAFMQDKTDDDWGNGSYSYRKAIDWLRENGDNAVREGREPSSFPSLVVVDDRGNDPVCVDEIEYKDLDYHKFVDYGIATYENHVPASERNKISQSGHYEARYGDDEPSSEKYFSTMKEAEDEFKQLRSEIRDDGDGYLVTEHALNVRIMDSDGEKSTDVQRFTHMPPGTDYFRRGWVSTQDLTEFRDVFQSMVKPWFHVEPGDGSAHSLKDALALNPGTGDSFDRVLLDRKSTPGRAGYEYGMYYDTKLADFIPEGEKAPSGKKIAEFLTDPGNRDKLYTNKDNLESILDFEKLCQDYFMFPQRKAETDY